MSTMSAASTADSKIAAVSEATSQLLRARAAAVKDNTLPGINKVQTLLYSHKHKSLLEQALSTLHECGIEVNAAKQGLEFRFDHCEGFSGAWQRIKAVQGQLEAWKTKSASLFVSDFALLARDPPSDPIEDGVWEVAGDLVHFKPKSFSQFSLKARHPDFLNNTMGSKKARTRWSCMMTYHLTVVIHVEPGNDLGTAMSVTFGADIRPPTGEKDTDEELAVVMRNWTNFMTPDRETKFTAAFKSGGVSSACKCLDSVMRDGVENLKQKWDDFGWTVEPAGTITVPNLLSPQWGVKHSEYRARAKAVLNHVAEAMKKTPDSKSSEETDERCTLLSSPLDA